MRYRPNIVPAGIAEGIAIAWDGSDPQVIAGCGAAAPGRSANGERPPRRSRRIRR